MKTVTLTTEQEITDYEDGKARRLRNEARGQREQDKWQKLTDRAHALLAQYASLKKGESVELESEQGAYSSCSDTDLDKWESIGRFVWEISEGKFEITFRRGDCWYTASILRNK